jgi:predicted transglutaminase-like cysteine proteinase
MQFMFGIWKSSSACCTSSLCSMEYLAAAAAAAMATAAGGVVEAAHDKLAFCNKQPYHCEEPTQAHNVKHELYKELGHCIQRV